MLGPIPFFFSPRQPRSDPSLLPLSLRQPNPKNLFFAATETQGFGFLLSAPHPPEAFTLEKELKSWLTDIQMPHKTRPMTALLVFTGVNFLLVQTITPVYDYVCFHPYWERRRERRRREREGPLAKDSAST